MRRPVSPTALPFRCDGPVAVARCTCGAETICMGPDAGTQAAAAWGEHMLTAYLGVS